MLQTTTCSFLAASLRRVILGLTVTLTFGFSQANAIAGAPQAIAYAGLVAPGTGGATFYPNTLPYGVIARGDSIVFPHYTTNFDYGLWRWRNGALSKIIFDGEALPGIPSQTYSGSPYSYAVDDSGRAAFSTYYGVFQENISGQLVKVTDRYTVAPGATGTFYQMDDINFRNGELSFRAQLSGGNINFGTWRTNGTALVPAVLDDQSHAGGGTITGTYNFGAPATAPNSTIIVADLSGNQTAIVKQTGSAMPVIVARSGFAAPGLATETFSSFYDPQSNSAGQIAFEASLSNGNVYSAIFRDLGAGPQFIVGNDSPMPGPTGARLTGLSNPLINNSGTIAFSGYLNAFSVPLGTGTEGLWTVNSSGVIHEVARENNPVPGMLGVTFENFIGVNFAINNQGQVAWLGDIAGTGITSSNDKGIWSTMPDGSIVSVVREGDIVQVQPGIFRTVRSISFAETPSFNGGVYSPWTDDQQLTYMLTFTDSTSGVFVSAVPEPGTMALTFCALGVLGYRVLRRKY
jgi:hypothetical protein